MNAAHTTPMLRWIAASADADRTMALPRASQPADSALLVSMNPISPATLLLQQRYRDSLPTKHADLTSRWQLLQNEPANLAAQSALQESVHRLAGSAGAYGYTTIGEFARSADALLIRHRELWDADHPQDLLIRELRGPISQLLTQLQSEF